MNEHVHNRGRTFMWLFLDRHLVSTGQRRQRVLETVMYIAGARVAEIFQAVSQVAFHAPLLSALRVDHRLKSPVNHRIFVLKTGQAHALCLGSPSSTFLFRPILLKQVRAMKRMSSDQKNLSRRHIEFDREFGRPSYSKHSLRYASKINPKESVSSFVLPSESVSYSSFLSRLVASIT